MRLENESLLIALYELLQKAFNLNKPKWEVIYPERGKSLSSATPTSSSRTSKAKTKTIVIDPIYEDFGDPTAGATFGAGRNVGQERKRSPAHVLASELKIIEGHRFNRQFYALVVGALRGNLESGNHGDPSKMLRQIITHYVKPRRLTENQIMGLIEEVKLAAQGGAFEFRLYDDDFIRLIAGFLPRPSLPGF